MHLIDVISRGIRILLRTVIYYFAGQRVKNKIGTPGEGASVSQAWRQKYFLCISQGKKTTLMEVRKIKLQREVGARLEMPLNLQI